MAKSKQREFVVTQEMKELLKLAGSPRKDVALAAQAEIAQAFEAPLRRGVLKGDIIGGIFAVEEFEPGATVEWPLHFLAPGTEKDHVAYTIPSHGYIPERQVHGDTATVPTYDVGNAIDLLLRYAREARWPVVEGALETLQGGFTRKLNNDGWHTLLAAANGRNLVVYDSQATGGFFTKRLVSLMKTEMRRRAGGNSTSLNQGRLTDLYVSPEAVEDVRNWDLTQVDDITRREIFVADDDGPTGEYSLTRVFGVNLHIIDELGVGQEYQKYFTEVLNATVSSPMPSGKQEIVLGLDLYNDDSFMMGVKEQIGVWEDDELHRRGKMGWYGRGNFGFASLSALRCLFGSL